MRKLERDGARDRLEGDIETERGREKEEKAERERESERESVCV